MVCFEVGRLEVGRLEVVCFEVTRLEMGRLEVVCFEMDRLEVGLYLAHRCQQGLQAH